MHKQVLLLALALNVATEAHAQEHEAHGTMGHDNTIKHENSPVMIHGADDPPIDWANDPAMRAARESMKTGAGGMMHGLFLIDRAEYRAKGDGQLIWDTQGWYGGDINRIWFKSEGEYDLGEHATEGGTIELLYGRAISPYFDLQAGFGQGLEAGGSPTYATIGLQGLAPQWFEVDAALQLDTGGNLSGTLEAEYELLFTQRLILQPRAELGISFQDIPQYDIGSGFTGIEAGLRLRYEISGQIAPFVGVSWHKKLGSTADIARADGHDADSLGLVIGLRSWF